MSHRWCVPLFAVLVAASLAGCTGSALPFGPTRDPIASTTFQDGGSDTATWVLLITGHFHLPHGTRFTLTANETSCTTTGWSEKVAGDTLSCHGEHREGLYAVTHLDLDDDGRASRDDRLEIRPAQTNATLEGPHRLVLALHPELPLFVLEQDFGPEGPMGPLAVELLG